MRIFSWKVLLAEHNLLKFHADTFQGSGSLTNTAGASSGTKGAAHLMAFPCKKPSDLARIDKEPKTTALSDLPSSLARIYVFLWNVLRQHFAATGCRG